MYISKKLREKVKQKCGGKCAYTGTKLKDDRQIDHVEPVRRNWWNSTAINGDNHKEDNMLPVQKIVNHYKGSLDLETFRTWYLAGLHERLKKLPKNPRTEKGLRRKRYLSEVANIFGITPDKPFSGIFYFETIKQLTT